MFRTRTDNNGGCRRPERPGQAAQRADRRGPGPVHALRQAELAQWQRAPAL